MAMISASLISGIEMQKTEFVRTWEQLRCVKGAGQELDEKWDPKSDLHAF